MTYRIRGPLDTKGRYIIAGIINLQRGKDTVLTLHGSCVSPDAPPPNLPPRAATHDHAGRPVPYKTEGA